MGKKKINKSDKYNISRKSALVFCLSLFFIMSAVFGLALLIENFTDNSTSISFSGNETINKSINIPRYVEINDAWMNVSGNSVMSDSLKDGLIAYYSFDETSGTTARDSTGKYNLTATESGIFNNYYIGKIGNCANFTNGTGFLNSTFSGWAENESFSISFWVKVDAGNNGNWIYVNSPDGYGYNFSGMYLTSTSSMETNVIFDSSLTKTYSKTNILDSQWHNIILTWNNSENLRKPHLFIDNVETILGTSVSSKRASATSSLIQIGGLEGGNISQDFNGSIDEVAIWNRTLDNVTEVSLIYNSGNGVTYSAISNPSISLNNTKILNLKDAELSGTTATLRKLNDSTTSKNLTFTGSSNQTVYLDIPKFANVTSASLNLSGLPSYSSCYQESANTSNQSGIDGNCGLNYSGSYSSSGTISNFGNMIDGNLATQGSCFPNTCYIYTNYTKPNNIVNPFINLKYTSSSIVNLTIPASCVNNRVDVRYHLWNSSATGYLNISCFNGTAYQQIGNPLETFWIYEEKIDWNISNYPSNVTLQVGNSSRYCYQESANTSNQTGIDGDCGLNYSGSYSFYGDSWNNNSSIIDGDFSTSSTGISPYCTTPTLNISYKKPISTSGAKVYIKTKSILCSNTSEVIIPNSCFNNNVYNLNLSIIVDKLYCLNSSGWQLIFSPTYSEGCGSTGGCARGLYEEGIYWDFAIFNQTGIFNTTNITSDFSSVINSYLSTCSYNSELLCSVPLTISSNSSGIVQISSISTVFNNISRSRNFSDTLTTALNSGACDCVGCTISGTNCTLNVSHHSDNAGVLNYNLFINYSFVLNTLLNSPTNGAILNTASNNFTANITGGVNITNATISIFNTTSLVNQTTQVFTPNLTVQFNQNITLPQGNYTWYVNSTDENGLSIESSNFTFIIDLTNPNVTSQSPANLSKINTSSYNFTANITDDFSGLKNWSINIYNSTGLVNQTIGTISNSLQQIISVVVGLVDNTYTWFVKVFDMAGNSYQTDNRTFYIDTTAPNVNILFPLAQDYNYHNQSLLLSISDNVVGLDICWKSLNGGTNVTFPCNQNTTVNNSVGTIEGVNLIEVWANDTLGHVSYDSVSFGVFTSKPVIVLYQPPQGDRLNYKQNILFNFSANASAGRTLVNCSLYTNTTGSWALNQTFNTPSYFTQTYKNVTDGSYIWNINCEDDIGNTNWASSNFSFIVDTTYPLISYGTNIENNATNFSRNWIFVNTTQTELYFKNITFNLYNTSLVNSTTYTSKIESINWTNLGDGYYYYNVTTCDLSNWCNTTETRQIMLDTNPPSFSIILPLNINYGDNTLIPLTYNVFDTLSSIGSCVYSVSNSTGIVNANVSLPNCENTTFSLPTGDVNYNITLYVNDSLGNMNVTNIPFGVRTESPAVNLYPVNNTFYNFNNVTLNFTVTTNADNISKCELYHNFNGTWLLNQTYLNPSESVVNSFNSTNISEGSYIWNVKCYDNFDHTGWAVNNNTLTIDNTNPNLTILAPSTTLSAKTFEIRINATDLNGLSKCYYNLTYVAGGSAETTNTEITNCQNITASILGTEIAYNLNVFINDSAGNINTTSRQIIYPTPVPPSGGGGGGGTTIINQGENDWYMYTTGKSTSYKVSPPKAVDKTYTLTFINDGSNARTLTFSCEDINGTLCDYVTFPEKSFTLAVVKDTEIYKYFRINLPLDIENAPYTFNIIATDETGSKKAITFYASVGGLDIVNNVLGKLSPTATSPVLNIPYLIVAVPLFIFLLFLFAFIYGKFKKTQELSIFLAIVTAFVLTVIALLVL